MKNLFRLTLLFLLTFSVANISAQEEAYIEGQTSVCIGECADYYFYIDLNGNPFPSEFATWSLNGISIQQQNPVTFCFDFAGVNVINVFDEEFGVEATLSVIANEFISTELESSAPSCNAETDSLTCEVLCAGSTVTYTLPGGGSNTTWSITGSDNFETNGNQATVTWSEPGSGSIVAFAQGDSLQQSLFNINCGEDQPVSDFGAGSAYVYIEGEYEEYIIVLTGANGANFTITGVNGLNIIDQIFSGFYSVEVTNPVGEVQTCELVINEFNPDNPDCFLSSVPELIQSPTSCDGECDGLISIIPQGGQPPYLYVWSNGSTTGVQSGLCAGTYSVTIYDVNGCETVEIITLAEPSCGGCGTEAFLCVEILEEPNAEFVTTPAASNGSVEICEGQTLFFQNQSTGAEDFIWDFGDFNTSTSVSPEHTYASPGTYTVSLIARNECFCSDTTSIQVTVIDADIPDIGCVGTICENSTVTYTSGAACGTFNWVISGNGSIQDGGGSNDDFVTVEWGNGPTGSVELSVEDCSGNVCNLPNIELIPIISDDAQIDGPNQVCNSTEAIYALPKYDGTDYTWSVSTAGTIIDGQGTHRITVLWEGAVPNNAQSVEVVYENCYLECGGSDVLAVSILPEYFILGTPAVCEDASQIFYGKNAETNGQASLNWQLFAPDGSVSYTSIGASISENIPFTDGAGVYRLVGTPGIATDWCTSSYELDITVNAKPVEPTSILGETNICAGEPYAYTAATSLANAAFIWEINDGGTITSLEGNPALITWSNSGSYTVSVAQIDTDGLNCQSDFISLNINAIGTVTVSGDDDVCLEETVIYTATDYVGVDYQWTISPAEAGTIATGQGSSEVEVFWTDDGNATLTLDICGQTETTNVLVRPKPIPVIIAPEWLCAGETATISTTVVYDSYLWKDEFGTIIANSATPDLGSGFYDVLVTNEFGCTENISFEIKRYPPPTVSISTPDNSNVCLAEGDPWPTLYAENTEAGYNFQWFQDGVMVGTDSPIFVTTEAGLYQVIVTDINSCQATSNTATVQEQCGPDGGGGQCQGGGINFCDPDIEYVFFDANPTAECNTFQFQSTTPNELNVVSWNFDDGTTSNETMPTHTFEDAGFYRVILYSSIDFGGGNSSTCPGEGIVTVPVAAKFDAQAACPGESVVFTDLSTFIPGESIVSRIWDFGDPASGVDNTSTNAEDTHVYSTAGSYTVTLTVTSANGCISIETQEVLVYPLPDVAFAPPVVNCAATSLEFIANVSANVTEVEWDFGDASSGEANTSTAFTSYHEFATPGIYTVTLMGTSIYGCSEMYQFDITVEPNTLVGNITAAPANVLCDGETAILTAPAGGVAWLWSTGETTSSISVNTGDVYEVTVTDGFGCTYTPMGMPVEVLPLPQGDIYAVEYDDFGNPVSYNFSTEEVCEGEDVYLEIEAVSNYSYSWSTGSMTESEEFSEDRGNQLVAGTYDIEVNITNDDTGCTNVSTYQVIVHGVPQNVTIISDTGFPLCSGNGATLSVQNPNAAFDYVWNTGETGTSISVITGGEYWVTAINEFGCEGESNHVDVLNAPDIDKIPDGCHTRCAPDTICLPTMPLVSSYQWYFNGTAVPAPEGTVADFIAEESGEYYVVMEDIFGCSSTSDPLTLDLFQGFGTFLGEVYLDTNENGIIDAGDQLVPDITINIFDTAGANQGTATTNNTGEYAFPNILSTEYMLELDTLTLPDLTTYTVYQVNSELIGCDVEETINWLIIPFCEPDETNLTFISCDGAPVDYDGTPVSAGSSQDFLFSTTNGCDSTVTVNVIDGFTPPSTDNYSVCGTETVEVEGFTLGAGDVVDVPFMNQYGCDSIVTITVQDAASPFGTDSFTVCDGESLNFNGTEINAGETQIITFTNQAGCDSLVEISLDAFPLANLNANAEESCWNISDGKIIIETPVGGLPPYSYSLDGVSFTSQTEYENLIGGEYTVYMRDGNGCEFTYDVLVPTAERIDIQALDQIIDCDSENVQVEALISGGAGDITYAWSTGEQTTEITASEPGVYTFTATDACGTEEVQVEVAYEFDTRLSLVFVPNAFSPNDDGANDVAKGFVANNVEVMEYNLMIFDRWGNLMDEIENPDNGWNGEFEGQRLRSGVFTYILKAKVQTCGVEKDITQSGDITLVR